MCKLGDTVGTKRWMNPIRGRNPNQGRTLGGPRKREKNHDLKREKGEETRRYTTHRKVNARKKMGTWGGGYRTTMRFEKMRLQRRSHSTGFHLALSVQPNPSLHISTRRTSPRTFKTIKNQRSLLTTKLP